MYGGALVIDSLYLRSAVKAGAKPMNSSSLSERSSAGGISLVRQGSGSDPWRRERVPSIEIMQPQVVESAERPLSPQAAGKPQKLETRPRWGAILNFSTSRYLIEFRRFF